MKTNALLAFFFFFLALFAITTAEIVYDADGDLLNNRGNYYLLPPNYGGVAIEGTPIGNGDGSCSLAVIAKVLYKNGWLTNIASPYRTLHITTDYPIYISFTKLPIGIVTCTSNPQWLVAKDAAFGENAVMVGDAEKFPTPRSGVFRIQAYDSSKFQYKLMFCFEHYKCENVGVKDDGQGNQRFIVTDDKKVEPFVFRFVKQTTSDISMVV